MNTFTYVVESIDGDYANLRRTDIETEELKLVARALLPEEITEGTYLLYEMMQYRILTPEEHANRGFSLVEILAVLVIVLLVACVLAPRLLNYQEEARQKADMQLADDVKLAIATAMFDAGVEDEPTEPITAESLKELLEEQDYPQFIAAVKEALGKEDFVEVNEQLKSEKYSPKAAGEDQFLITIENQSVCVTLQSDTEENADYISK